MTKHRVKVSEWIGSEGKSALPLGRNGNALALTEGSSSFWYVGVLRRIRRVCPQ